MIRALLFRVSIKAPDSRTTEGRSARLSNGMTMPPIARPTSPRAITKEVYLPLLRRYDCCPFCDRPYKKSSTTWGVQQGP